MQSGDILRLETPGGGGYGSPFDRNVDEVLEDVRRGYYGREVAESEYGVVIREGEWEIDEAATAALKSGRNEEESS